MSEAGDNPFTDGEANERLMGRWSRLVGQAFLDWLDVPKGLRWFDVGCGNGAFTEELVARCAPASAMAVDPSEGQLSFARKRPGTKNAEFRVGDAQALPFDDDSFDVAIMALVLGFLPHPDKAVAELTRVVKPGGWVATYMWDLPGGGAPVTPFYEVMETLVTTSARPPRPDDSTQDSMRAFWKRCGLQAIETRVIRIPIVFADFDDFWNSNTVPIGPQGKLFAAMSPDARAQLRALLLGRMAPAADGRIVYESFANAVKGRVP